MCVNWLWSGDTLFMSDNSVDIGSGNDWQREFNSSWIMACYLAYDLATIS